MLVVETLRLSTIKRKSRSLLLFDDINTSQKKREIKTFVNIETEKIFVSQAFIKNSELSESDIMFTQTRAIDEPMISFYEKHDLKLTLTNSRARKRTKFLKAYAVDMNRYDFILEYS